jgi:hypothetical protein
LLERLAELTDEADAERHIAEHLATCPVCSAGDQRLTSLLASYSRSSPPPIPDALERRLLGYMCGEMDE